MQRSKLGCVDSGDLSPSFVWHDSAPAWQEETGDRLATWLHNSTIDERAHMLEGAGVPARARSVGVYRLWRDGGFAVGALLARALADAVSIEAAIWAVAAPTALSGLVVVRMYETDPR